MKIFTHIPLACSRVSDSGEDKKLKGMRRVGGAGKRKRKRQVQKSDRINSDRQSGSDQLGSTRIIKRKIKSVGVTYLSPAILFFSHELVVA